MIVFTLFLFVTSFNYLLCGEIAFDSENDKSFEIDLSQGFDSTNASAQSCSGEVLDDSVLDSYAYLQRYGYLPEDKPIADITSDEYSNALIEFQHFLNIEITGLLDENTTEAMKKKRCTKPDLSDSKVKRRSKRSLGSKKWVPYDMSAPELKLNWYCRPYRSAINQMGADVYGDVIEEAAQVWMNVADVKLRRLPNLQINKFEHVVFGIDPAPSNQKEKIKYEVVYWKATANLEVAGKVQYDAVWIYVYSNASAEEIANELKPKALYMFVHIWGLVLGLESNTDNPNSVMYPITEDRTDYTLTQDDITDIQTLYGESLNGNQTDLAYLDKKRADTHSRGTDLCEDSRIDSILEMPDQTWIVFRGAYYYEIGPQGLTLRSPRRINWDFPKFVGSVDASLTWNDQVFLFTGNNYFKYKQNNFITKRKISEGFPGIPDGPFDDIFSWYVNQKTYFFKGGQYWKYDSKKKGVASGFPKKVSENWKGIPHTFDAAISSRHRNQTYFFKGHQFWRFDDKSKEVVNDTNPPYPRNTDIYFIKCRNKKTIPRTKFEEIGTTTEGPPTPSYDEPPNKTAPEWRVIDDNTSLNGTFKLFLVILSIIILAVGAISAYLFFVVLRKMGQGEPPQTNIAMTDRPSDPSNAHTEGISQSGESIRSFTPKEIEDIKFIDENGQDEVQTSQT